jgi:hypothetical protein
MPLPETEKQETVVAATSEKEVVETPATEIVSLKDFNDLKNQLAEMAKHLQKSNEKKKSNNSDDEVLSQLKRVQEELDQVKAEKAAEKEAIRQKEIEIRHKELQHTATSVLAKSGITGLQAEMLFDHLSRKKSFEFDEESGKWKYAVNAAKKLDLEKGLEEITNSNDFNFLKPAKAVAGSGDKIQKVSGNRTEVKDERALLVEKYVLGRK